MRRFNCLGVVLRLLDEDVYVCVSFSVSVCVFVFFTCVCLLRPPSDVDSFLNFSFRDIFFSEGTVYFKYHFKILD